MKIDGDDLVKGVILSEVLSEDSPPDQGPPTQPVPVTANSELMTWVALLVVGVGFVLLVGLVALVWHVVARIAGGGAGG